MIAAISNGRWIAKGTGNASTAHVMRFAMSRNVALHRTARGRFNARMWVIGTAITVNASRSATACRNARCQRIAASFPGKKIAKGTGLAKRATVNLYVTTRCAQMACVTKNKAKMQRPVLPTVIFRVKKTRTVTTWNFPWTAMDTGNATVKNAPQYAMVMNVI